MGECAVGPGCSKPFQSGVAICFAAALLSAGPAWPLALSFQQGDGGLHSDTDATFIQGRAGVNFSAGGPGANFGSVDTLAVDDDPGGSAGNPNLESLTRILLRFPGLLGPASDQVPFGAVISSASITLQTTADEFAGTGASLSVHEILVPWSESSVTWDSFGGGGTAGAEYSAAQLSSFGPNAVSAAFTFDITSAAQSWSQGAANLGVFITSASDDVVFFFSDDHALQAFRPRLDIDFAPIPEPSTALMLGLGLGLVGLKRAIVRDLPRAFMRE
jgi:hypothetical protein